MNDAETAAIVRAVAARSPTFIALLGDLVFNGRQQAHWEYLDHVLEPLRAVPLFPVLGNHDYCSSTSYVAEDITLCDNTEARGHYHDRFPRSIAADGASWYLLRPSPT